MPIDSTDQLFPFPFAEQLENKTFSFFGDFSYWRGRTLSAKSYSPIEHVENRGAQVFGKTYQDHDYVVFGAGRAAGKTPSRRKAEKWVAEGSSQIQILDEAEFHYLIRPELKDITFFFTGGFHLGPAKIDGAPSLIQQTGAVICDDLDEEVRVVVIGDRRAKGKTQHLRELDQLQSSSGWNGLVLNEQEYLDFATLQQSPDDNPAENDLAGMVLQLRGHVDARRVDRAIAMLKKEAFQIFADVNHAHLSGVIKSQTSSEKIYAPWIDANGGYGCQCFPSYSNELEPCMGLQGHICKHLIALLLGLSKSGEVSTTQVLDMVRTVGKKRPKDKDTDLSAQILLRYKGAESGEVDWRPVETVPEDFYVL